MASGPAEVVLLLAAGLGVLCALLAALAFIGWRVSRSGALPPAARRRAATPPDAGVEWAAEIEWRYDPDGRSRFSIVAGRDGETERTTLSASEPLGWPPTGPESVHALRRAVHQLEADALAAGWRPAPPGEAWYAKRFVWQPGRPAD